MIENTNWKKIRSFAYDLIVNKKTCYSHLNDDEKHYLTGLIIKDCTSLHAHEFINESDMYENLPYVLADFMAIERKCSEDAIDKAEALIQFMCDKASDYASKRIDNLLSDLYDQYQHDLQNYIPEGC